TPDSSGPSDGPPPRHRRRRLRPLVLHGVRRPALPVAPRRPPGRLGEDPLPPLPRVRRPVPPARLASRHQRRCRVNARRGLAQYEPVEERVPRCGADRQDGRLPTEAADRANRQYLGRAGVYTDRDDERPAATGYAKELIRSNPANKTNALENAETTAVGRALANLNYAPKG